MATSNKQSFDEICRDIRAKRFAPVYVLMGEEPYFIDQIEKLLIENVLDDADRDFNQMIFYGADADAEAVVNAARRYPMMAERQLVVLKEAQTMFKDRAGTKKFDTITNYIKTYSDKTVFVICHKYGNIDGRKALVPAAKKVGVVYESAKLYSDKMPTFIMNFVKEQHLSIDAKGTQMLTDFIGTDISRLAKEIDKLKIVLKEQNSNNITPELIEQNIGISKNFNTFELVNAIASKDVLRANRIADYFDKNQKENPIQVVLPTIFNYFVNLMICIYGQCRTERDVMGKLGLKWNFQTTDYMLGLRNYNAMKVYNIIHEIRISDAKSKGFENTSATTGEIYKELLYKILH